MPTFSTPQPIDLAINLQVGATEIIASDRSDTVVTVEPTNSAKAVDRRGAEETKVDFDGGRLTIKGPRPRISFIGPTESVDLRIELPTGSRVTVELPVGFVRASGRLGATRIKALTGSVQLEDTADLWIRAGHGTVSVDNADGGAEITSDHGQIRVGSISGDSILKASHGAIAVRESGGDLQAKLSYGDFEVTKALGSVTAKTAYGRIQLGEVSSGSIQLDSGYGEIAIGVRAGVAAWLDLSSKEGRVRNELESDRAPEPTDDTVTVRARAQFGDIIINRSRKGSKK
jgi:hypothetical protein